MLDKSVETRKVVGWVQEGINRALPEYCDPVMVRVCWSNRLTTTLGKANRNNQTITLNWRAWELMTEDDRKNTLFHELGHLLALAIWGEDGWGHTTYWRVTMSDLGYPQAERFAPMTEQLRTLKRSVKRHLAACNCRDDVQFTTGQARAMARGAVYCCRSCYGKFRLTGEIVLV